MMLNQILQTGAIRSVLKLVGRIGVLTSGFKSDFICSPYCAISAYSVHVTYWKEFSLTKIEIPGQTYLFPCKTIVTSKIISTLLQMNVPAH